MIRSPFEARDPSGFSVSVLAADPQPSPLETGNSVPQRTPERRISPSRDESTMSPPAVHALASPPSPAVRKYPLALSNIRFIEILEDFKQGDFSGQSSSGMSGSVGEEPVHNQPPPNEVLLVESEQCLTTCKKFAEAATIEAVRMAANCAESSRQLYDPIPDNNNPPAPSPTVRSVHHNPVPTSVLAEGTLLPEPAPVQPAVVEPVHPSQPPSIFLQVVLNEDSGPLQDDERAMKRQRQSPSPGSLGDFTRGALLESPPRNHGVNKPNPETVGVSKENTHGFGANGTAPSGQLLKRKKVDAARFDALMYAQVGASSPLPDITPPALPAPPSCFPKPPKQKDAPLYLPIDPRIHWPQPHSASWHAAKQAEIRARGGRKANFGQATQSLRRRRGGGEVDAHSDETQREALDDGRKRAAQACGSCRRSLTCV